MEQQINILIVEDENRMREFIKSYLQKEGWNTFEAHNGHEALEIFSEKRMDLVLLDIMMPEIDGRDTCKRIRETSDVHIIMITALSGEESQMECYEIGADDYITKPFKGKVLAAKIKRLLQSGRIGGKSHVYENDNLKIDYLAREVYLQGKRIKFSPKEYELLVYLVKHKNTVKTREQMLDAVWGHDYFGGTRVVDNHILKIRNKLSDQSIRIKTMVNVGYKYEEK